MLESTCAEPIAPGAKKLFADFPIDRLTSMAIRVLRDRKVKLLHAANNRLKEIRYVLSWVMEAEHLRSNPARDVVLIRAPSDDHHTWTLDELEQFEACHPVGIALHLLMHTGARRSDIVRLGRQHVRDGWLRFTQVTTKTGFGNKFRGWCNEAELPSCSALGLRKAAATRAAENGTAASQSMAMFG